MWFDVVKPWLDACPLRAGAGRRPPR
jgi:hypothetical protein